MLLPTPRPRRWLPGQTRDSLALLILQACGGHRSPAATCLRGSLLGFGRIYLHHLHSGINDLTEIWPKEGMRHNKGREHDGRETCPSVLAWGGTRQHQLLFPTNIVLVFVCFDASDKSEPKSGRRWSQFILVASWTDQTTFCSLQSASLSSAEPAGRSHRRRSTGGGETTTFIKTDHTCPEDTPQVQGVSCESRKGWRQPSFINVSLMVKKREAIDPFGPDWNTEFNSLVWLYPLDFNCTTVKRVNF